MKKTFNTTTLCYGRKEIKHADTIKNLAMFPPEENTILKSVLPALPRKHRHLVVSNMAKILKKSQT